MITKNSAFGFGVLGVTLFVATTILAGFLNPNYNHSSQFISELVARLELHGTKKTYLLKKVK